MIGKTDKCLNPWFGFLIILSVCVVISAAIFYEFRGNPGHRRPHRKTAPRQTVTPAAAPSAGGGVAPAADKLTF
ncbi:MAG: hypothetical protein HQL23_02565 [Candidatus Omnitrophica bacterium]|nr:hypothetical protein [Candidatus Omnitrophota bacterium]